MAKEKQKTVEIPSSLSSFIARRDVSVSLRTIVLSDKCNMSIQRVVQEHRVRHTLRDNKLDNRNKLLFYGPPGTGKTMTSAIVSQRMDLPFFSIITDSLVGSLLGETCERLNKVFGFINDNPGVYLFDEFDSIGSQRGDTTQTAGGEMRRAVNSFLTLIDHLNHDSVIIVATNDVCVLDRALFRRFDDVLLFDLPTKKEREDLIEKYTLGFDFDNGSLDELSGLCYGFSHAEISKVCINAKKKCVIGSRKKINVDDVLDGFSEILSLRETLESIQE